MCQGRVEWAGTWGAEGQGRVPQLGLGLWALHHIAGGLPSEWEVDTGQCSSYGEVRQSPLIRKLPGAGPSPRARISASFLVLG